MFTIVSIIVGNHGREVSFSKSSFSFCPLQLSKIGDNIEFCWLVFPVRGAPYPEASVRAWRASARNRGIQSVLKAW
jgi:hypothetical protein